MAVDPPSFELRIEEKMSRVVPVEVLTVGQVPDEFVVDPGAISYEPRSVRVTGPRSKVEKIERITSYPIALDGLRRDLRAEIWLKRPPEQFVSLGTDQITVEIAVYEQEGETVLSDVPVYVDNCGEDQICSASPSRVSLTVRGSLSRIRWMEKQQDTRWLLVNAREFQNTVGEHENALVLARPVTGVVLLPNPRKVKLRIQSLAEESAQEDAVVSDDTPQAPGEEALSDENAAEQPDDIEDTQ